MFHARRTAWYAGGPGVVAALFVLAAAAPGAAAEETTINVISLGGEDGYRFEVEGLDGENPPLTFQAGETYTVHFTNEDTAPHDLVFGAPINERTAVLASGESETLTFTVPEDAVDATTYWCNPHQHMGMEGDVTFEGGVPSNGNGENRNTGNGNNGNGNGGEEEEEVVNGAPAPALLAVLAAIGLAALARRRR